MLSAWKNLNDLGAIPPKSCCNVRSIMFFTAFDWYDNFCTPALLDINATEKVLEFINFHDTDTKHILVDTSALQGIPDASSKQTHATA
jgi:hypothetical protein